MCVCKSWKLLISDPQFVKSHLHRSSSTIAYTRLLFDLFNSHPEEETNVALPYTVSLLFSSQNQKGHELYPIENGYQLIGVCNGLASLIKVDCCFANKIPFTARFRFWNPARRLSSQLSPPLYLLQPTYTFGFGYDCFNDTYKVVVVNRKGCQVKVYDMSGTCWRTIQSFPAPSLESLTSLENGVYVRGTGGTLNWIVTNTNVPIIVSLHLGTEEYSQFSLPDSQHNPDLLLLGVFKDCLCILHNEGETRFLVWQMNHKGWTQLFSFERTTLLYNPLEFLLSENEEILLMSGHELVLYNQRYNTSKFWRVRNYHFIYSWNAYQVESLVSPC